MSRRCSTILSMQNVSPGARNVWAAVLKIRLFDDSAIASRGVPESSGDISWVFQAIWIDWQTWSACRTSSLWCSWCLNFDEICTAAHTGFGRASRIIYGFLQDSESIGLFRFVVEALQYAAIGTPISTTSTQRPTLSSE